MTDDPHRLSDIAALEAHYGAPPTRALVKELDHIAAPYRAFVEAAPFVVIATAGPEGLDASPRGDPAGFVRVTGPQSVEIPDRPGNNRLDTLRNILRDRRVALLFLIPGIGETFRINGRAEITVDPELCAAHGLGGRPARAVIRVAVERCYYQCQKALVRGRLWDAEAQIARDRLPSAGDMLAAFHAAEGTPFDGARYDADYPERMARTLY